MKNHATFLLVFALMLALTGPLVAQVSVNTDGTNPDGSAMLDVKSTTKGMLVPRMTTAQRTAIAAAAKGLLVFDITTNTFWFHNGTAWANLVGSGGSGNATEIKDTDGNTKVQTEANPNEDIIRFLMGGTSAISFVRNPAGGPRIELPFFLNTIVGEGAGANVTPGANSAGTGNSLYGYQSGAAINAGLNNTGIGYHSLLSTTSGSYNSGFGVGALRNNTTGNYNTAAGIGALYNNTTANGNTAFGASSLNANTTGESNTGIGFQSLFSNTTGVFNTGLGHSALLQNTIGNHNVAVGPFALQYNTTGSNLVAVGSTALLANTTGADNTAVGKAAGISNTTGSNNLFVGLQAGLLNTTGYYNTNIGRSSGEKNVTGHENTTVGGGANLENTSGSLNTIIGYGSLLNNVSGSNNTVIGHSAGLNNINGSGNVFLGFQAGYNETGSNRFYIGNSTADMNSILMYGEFDNKKLRINNMLGVGRLPTTNAFEINGIYASKAQAGAWSSNSDSTLKTDIHYLDKDPEKCLSKILQLRAVTYRWNDNKTGYARPTGIQTGFLAQNVQRVFPEKVQMDKQGFLQTAYSDYDPMIVESLRALNNKIEAQQQQIADLQKQLIEKDRVMMEELAALKAAVARVKK